MYNNASLRSNPAPSRSRETNHILMVHPRVRSPIPHISSARLVYIGRARTQKVASRVDRISLQLVLQRQAHLFQPADLIIGLDLVLASPLELGVDLVLSVVLDGHGPFKKFVLALQFLILGG